MISETSLDAYRDIKPRLGEMQDKVLGVFYERPFKQDLTNREIADALGVDVCSVTGRVYELRKMGLLVHSRNRLCSITYRRVQAWRLNEVRVK